MADKLMIVAHPDDEMIFAGKELLLYKNWKVICVTGYSNKVRRKEFEKAMNMLDIEDYEIWDYPDIWKGDFDRKKLSNDIKNILKEGEYIEVLTHSTKGEYGHTQHKAIGEIVNKLVDKNLYEFNVAKRMINIRLLLKKCKLLISIYKSERRVIFSFEVRKYILCEAKKKVK